MTAPLFQPSGLGSTNPFTVNSEDTYNANSLDTGFDTFAASSGPAPSGGGSGAPATNYYGAAPATSHFATTTDFVESAPTYSVSSSSSSTGFGSSTSGSGPAPPSVYDYPPAQGEDRSSSIMQFLRELLLD